MKQRTLRQALDEVRQRHNEYIEGTYHIRHPRLIRERREFLRQPRGTATHPWIEANPGYVEGPEIADLGLPREVQDTLLKFAKNKLGVFDPPHLHQASAIQAFFNDEKDLVVSTGTGSGKTEIFLYSILGTLMREAKRSPSSAQKRGVRAIILYPMNALVSDQLSRLRRFFGGSNQAQIIREGFGRTVQFGMYTSRTPYHGQFDVKKNNKYVSPIVRWYAALQEQGPLWNDRLKKGEVPPEQIEEARRIASLYQELSARGRIPAKDMVGFNRGKTEARFRTQPGDRELFTRQEMHDPVHGHAPDILITNYSMLEYMLLRPIEQPLFDSTREWLKSDPANQLLLVIDEAHLYRGAQGAEVALLIRRLLQHLGVSRDRVRCILTSASLGSPAEAALNGRRFASQLAAGTEDRYVVVLGQPKKKNAPPALPPRLLDPLTKVSVDLDRSSLQPLFDYFGWGQPSFTSTKPLQEFLADHLVDSSEFATLHDVLASKAHRLDDAASILFPGQDSTLATLAVLNFALVATFARHDDDSPLLPVRLHMMFRGLPGHYACVNPSCNGRRAVDGGELLGRIYFEPRLRCEYCGSRVFELMTHRTCGAAYLKAFVLPHELIWPRFLWTDSRSEELREFHLLVERPRSDADRHPDGDGTPLVDRTKHVYMDRLTGFVFDEKPPDEGARYVDMWWPVETPKAAKPKKGPISAAAENNVFSWMRCPACGIAERRPDRIQDLQTKGEDPFANIVRSMFQVQPPQPDSTLPNRGKKVLCFSDGRQKAARLARDLQRAVEQDSFRSVLLLAAESAPRGLTMEGLYVSFLLTCKQRRLVFFDDGDETTGTNAYPGSRTMFERALKQVDITKEDYGIDSDEDLLVDAAALADLNAFRPWQYNAKLLRVLGDPYYSVRATLTGEVVATRPVLDGIIDEVPDVEPALIEAIVQASIDEAVAIRAFDKDLPSTARRLSRASPGYPFGWTREEGIERDELIPKAVRDAIEEVTADQFKRMSIQMRRGTPSKPALFVSHEMKFWLNPQALVLRPSMREIWKRCTGCGRVSSYTFGNFCPDPRCSAQMAPVSTDDDNLYVNARRDFLRRPAEEVLHGVDDPFVLRSEEHTAQLTTKDRKDVFGKAETYELLFQDVLVEDLATQQPVDVLSCTTTMEVGIDIGSLTSVALRTVPPRPDNYQQRSGRAGRRKSALSIIATYADTSPYESFIFENPERLIGRDSGAPVIYVGNAKIAQRHINASLLQKFFHRKGVSAAAVDAAVFESLGAASSFFAGSGAFSFEAFQVWLKSEVWIGASLVEDLGRLMPDELSQNPEVGNGAAWRTDFVKRCAAEFEANLADLAATDWSSVSEDEDNLLSTLLSRALLPTFSFPIDLCVFAVRAYEEKADGTVNRGSVVNKYEMSQDLGQALSEYAPGRELVVDKRTFESYGLYYPFPPDPVNRASGERWTALKWLNQCNQCPTVLDQSDNDESGGACPVCPAGQIIGMPRIRPHGFSPREGPRGAVDAGTGDRDRHVSATAAQMPIPMVRVPATGVSVQDLPPLAEVRMLANQRLLIANNGPNAGGFHVCQLCGAVGTEGALRPGHPRPYPIPRRKGMSAPPFCNGLAVKAAFAYDFQTDLTILRVDVTHALDWAFGPDYPWCDAAARSLSEAFVIGAARAIGIDKNELAGNYTFTTPYIGDDESIVLGHLEFFVFDETSGGAGFAAKVAEHADSVLAEVERILSECHCDTSCDRCLRTYSNRIHHGVLNRHYALSLLRYARSGQVPPLDDERLKYLNGYLRAAAPLRLSGVKVEANGSELVVTRGNNSLRVAVAPALRRRPKNLFSASPPTGLVLTDYEVEHLLPLALARIADALDRA